MTDIFANKRIEKTIEVICQRGCEYVRQVIIDLDAESLENVVELREQSDRKVVLTELKSIMSVYEDSGGACCPVPKFIGNSAGHKKSL